MVEITDHIRLGRKVWIDHYNCTGLVTHVFQDLRDELFICLIGEQLKPIPAHQVLGTIH